MVMVGGDESVEQLRLFKRPVPAAGRPSVLAGVAARISPDPATHVDDLAQRRLRKAM